MSATTKLPLSTSKSTTNSSVSIQNFAASTTALATVQSSLTGLASQAHVGFVESQALSTTFEGMHSSNNLQDLPTTKFDVNVAEDNYVSLNNKGFNEQRPELIAQFDFEHVFDDTMSSKKLDASASPVGELIDISVSMRQLRAENITRLMNELKADEKSAPIVSELERRSAKVNGNVETELKFLNEMVSKINAAKKSLSVKTNSRQIDKNIATQGGITNISNSSDVVKHLIVDVLKFSDAGYNAFSDTKILMQLLDDLRNITKSFSLQLVDMFNAKRSSDVDPYELKKFKDTTNQGSLIFDIGRLKSSASSDVRKFLSLSEFIKFQSAFDGVQQPLDKISAIITILSKELRVSAGLSMPQVVSLLSKTFGVNVAAIQNDVFDNILGEPGNTIFDNTVGSRDAFINLLKMKTEDGDEVLPFEPMFIKKSKQHIPGQKFYIDSIMRGRTKFLTRPFKNFASTFSGKAFALANIVEGTFDVNVVNKDDIGLNPNQLFDKLLISLKPVVAEMAARDTQRDTFFVAMLSKAAEDVQLKYFLSIYVLCVCANDTHPFFADMIEAMGFNNITFKTALSLEIQNYLPSSAQNAGANTSATTTSYAAQPVSESFESEKDLASMNQPSGKSSSTNANPTVVAATQFRDPLDTICELIIERMFKLVYAGGNYANLQADSTLTTENSLSVLNRLMTLGKNDTTFIMRSIIEFIKSFDSLIRKQLNAGTSYFSSIVPGLTKFNNIGMHTIVWMVVELYTTFFKIFPLATFKDAFDATANRSAFYAGTTKQLLFYVLENKDLCNKTKILLDVIVSNKPTSMQQPQNGAIYYGAILEKSGNNVREDINAFIAVKRKLEIEDELIKSIIKVFIAVGEGMKSSADELEHFFDEKGPNSDIIKALKSSADFDDKMSMLNFAQISLMKNALFEQQFVMQATKQASKTNAGISLRKLGDTSPFIDDTIISQDVKAALFKMLAMPEFVSPASDNLKILSVGLPSGFLESLQLRLKFFYAFDKNLSEYKANTNMRSDIIKLNVYMKDLLFEDVVFKPKSFIFQVGRFVSAVDFGQISADDTRDFSALARDAIATRAIASDGSSFATEIGQSLASDNSYGFLTSDQKRQLANNHIMSYLLKMYIKILVGVDLSEENFYINDAVSNTRVDAETQALFKTLIETRVSGFVQRKVTLEELRASNPLVQDLLSMLQQDEITANVVPALGKVLEDASKVVNLEVSNDLETFMKIFTPSSMLIGAGARNIRLTSPKLFERIFHVVVDPDEFEIDNKLTASTQAGRTFLSKLNSGITSTTTVSQSDTENTQPKFKIDPIQRQKFGSVSLQQFFVTIEQMPAELLKTQSTAVPKISADEGRTPVQDQYTRIVNYQADVDTPPPTLNFNQNSSISSLPMLQRDGVSWSKIIS